MHFVFLCGSIDIISECGEASKLRSEPTSSSSLACLGKWSTSAKVTRYKFKYL
jgi:hypothetical protein